MQKVAAFYLQGGKLTLINAHKLTGISSQPDLQRRENMGLTSICKKFDKLFKEVDHKSWGHSNSQGSISRSSFWQLRHFGLIFFKKCRWEISEKEETHQENIYSLTLTRNVISSQDFFVHYRWSTLLWPWKASFCSKRSSTQKGKKLSQRINSSA